MSAVRDNLSSRHVIIFLYNSHQDLLYSLLDSFVAPFNQIFNRSTINRNYNARHYITFFFFFFVLTDQCRRLFGRHVMTRAGNSDENDTPLL